MKVKRYLILLGGIIGGFFMGSISNFYQMLILHIFWVNHLSLHR